MATNIASMSWGPMLVILIIPVFLILSLVVRLRRARREEMLIRQWADKHGYAITRLQRYNLNLLDLFLFFLIGWLMWWVTYRWGWRLTVSDSEGGEKNMVVRVRRDGQVEEYWDSFR